MRKVILLATVTSALYFMGCAMQQQKPRQAGWTKPGVSKYDADNAYAQCEYDVSMQKIDPAEKDKTVRYCMMRQGYRYGYYE